MKENKATVIAEDIIEILEKRYSDLYLVPDHEKTQFQHGIRAGIDQVLKDIRSIIDG